MAVSRFQIAANKKTALMKQQMREIAKLLAEEPQPKEEKARIRAEALIREDNTVEAYEILQLECELVFERVKLITSMKECPEDLKSCIATLIWSSNRVDIPELQEIRKQFRYKYGKKFEEACLNNVGGVLNERVVAKLSVQPPSAYLVQTYLEKIADEFEVDWKPAIKLGAEDLSAPMVAPVGYSVQIAPGTGLAPAGVPPPSNPGDGFGDDDMGSAGGGSGGGGGVSVAAASRGTSTLDDIPSAPAVPPFDKYDDIPSATAVPMPMAPAAAPAPAASAFDLEEPDIFIPAAPGQGGGSSKGATGGTSVGGKSTGLDSNNTDDRDDGSNGGGGSSYDDLAARFSQLKK
jgi:vacuolar protein sorting-associated protein IST1